MEAIFSNMLSCDGEFVVPPIAVGGRGGTGAGGGAFTLRGQGPQLQVLVSVLTVWAEECWT